MDYIFFELQWMLFNILLACLPVLFIQVFIKNKSRILRSILFLLWLFFLPNTLYLLTDITHLFSSISLTPFVFIPVTILLYILLVIIGLLTFLLALTPLEKFLQKRKNINGTLFLVIINFLVGIGVMLGRVERANSWDVLVHPFTFLWNSYALFSHSGSITAAFIWGLGANIFYFAMRSTIDKITPRKMKQKKKI